MFQKRSASFTFPLSLREIKNETERGNKTLLTSDREAWYPRGSADLQHFAHVHQDLDSSVLPPISSFSILRNHNIFNYVSRCWQRTLRSNRSVLSLPTHCQVLGPVAQRIMFRQRGALLDHGYRQHVNRRIDSAAPSLAAQTVVGVANAHARAGLHSDARRLVGTQHSRFFSIQRERSHFQLVNYSICGLTIVRVVDIPKSLGVTDITWDYVGNFVWTYVIPESRYCGTPR